MATKKNAKKAAPKVAAKVTPKTAAKAKTKTAGAAVADIPAEVTTADLMSVLKSIDKRLESVRRIFFYIPEVVAGVKAAQAKKANADEAAEPNGD